uniref:oxytocin receptor-like n=1 Tax=Myxine glutinosa TaxID=7769 RepID=UPI00358F8364
MMENAEKKGNQTYNGTELCITNSSLDCGGSRDEALARIEVAILAAIFVAALVGNICVLAVLLKGKNTRTKSRMQFFIAHLSIADLTVALFQVLPQLAWDVTFRFQGPDALCRIVKYLQTLGMFASTYLLIAMALDRYMAICHPLRTLQQPCHRAHAMVATAWSISAVFSTPQVFIFSLQETDPGKMDCWADFVYPWAAPAYITCITIVVYVAPVLMLSASYGLISLEIWSKVRSKKHTHRAQLRCPEGGSRELSRVSSVRGISRAKVRTIKMTFVIVLAYVVCWTPFFTVQMWSVWDHNAPGADSRDKALTLTMLLASLNSCCNPWIYMFFSGHLLHALACCRLSTHWPTRASSLSTAGNVTSLSCASLRQPSLDGPVSSGENTQDKKP